jgi:hypothetical protein
MQKLTAEEINENATVDFKNFGKNAVRIRTNPFDMATGPIHKRTHYLEEITIIGFGETENCYLCQCGNEQKEIHAMKVIRIGENQIPLIDTKQKQLKLF